jgi:hypothetical protein
MGIFVYHLLNCINNQIGFIYLTSGGPPPLVLFNRFSGQATQRHPEYPPYCCFFSDLTGFEGFRRAGPTRSAASITYEDSPVNVLLVNEH